MKKEVNNMKEKNKFIQLNFHGLRSSNDNKKFRMNVLGFTLVELLAVIVILAIILVIGVPKIMGVIEDSKKAVLESSAKMIASSAEKVKIQNQILGKNDDIRCEDVVKINEEDYGLCIIEFDNDSAKVTIVGKGKFIGLNVCNGTKTDAKAGGDVCSIPYGVGTTYITNLLAQENAIENGLKKTRAIYKNSDNKEIIVDTGIRYVGEMNSVNNQVYFNCETTDGTNDYGSENYNYESSCEKWRIIGVVDAEDSDGNKEKRIKLINTSSTFTASWDSSISGDNPINKGFGINEWGTSGEYKGADIMQLLNGFYIGEDTTCVYCTESGQENCSETCTAESLKAVNMKKITNTAKSMIDEIVWDTYAVDSSLYPITSSNAGSAYLQEKGISSKQTGKKCTSGDFCTDNVERTTSSIGFVGLMSVSDIGYANGWLYNQDGTSLYSWTITPYSSSDYANRVWYADGNNVNGDSASNKNGIFPSVYLKSNVEIIGGNGKTEPYKLFIR